MKTRPSRKTGDNKVCACGFIFYCPKWAWDRKKYCSKDCFYEYKPVGHAMNEEAKEKIRVAHKGMKHTEATRNKIGAFWLGTKFSNERLKKHKASIKYGSERSDWKGGYERKLWLNNQRRIKRIGNGGSHSFEEWENLKLRFGFMCLRCKKTEPQIKLTRDHIIPISKGGTDFIHNIQPLCGSCNAVKHDKTINYMKLHV